MNVTDKMAEAAKAFFEIRTTATISIPQYTPYDAFIGGWNAALSIDRGEDSTPTPTDRISLYSGRSNDPIPEGWGLNAVYLSITHRTGDTTRALNFEAGLEEYVQSRIRSALNAKGE